VAEEVIGLQEYGALTKPEDCRLRQAMPRRAALVTPWVLVLQMGRAPCWLAPATCWAPT